MIRFGKNKLLFSLIKKVIDPENGGGICDLKNIRNALDPENVCELYDIDKIKKIFIITGVKHKILFNDINSTYGNIHFPHTLYDPYSDSEIEEYNELKEYFYDEYAKQIKVIIKNIADEILEDADILHLIEQDELFEKSTHFKKVGFYFVY